MKGVRVEPNKIVATDGIKLIEHKYSTGVEESFTVKMPEGVKTFLNVEDNGHFVSMKDARGREYLTSKIDEDFPDYEKVMPKGKPKMTILLSPVHLEAICTAFKGLSNEAIKIEIFDPLKPVVFTSKDEKTRAMLAPMMK